MAQEGANMKPLCIILGCTFAGGDERGGFRFRGEQLRYPCKLRRHICAKCGMHRGEHHMPKPNAGGIRDELLPPRKRSAFRRLGEFQLPGRLSGGGGGEEEEKEEALPLVEEGQSWPWIGSAITKGKRSPRRKRADLLQSLND